MKARAAFVIFLFLCLVFNLHADDMARTIFYEVKVYAWNFEEGFWYENQVIKKITETYGADGNLTVEELADAKGNLLEKTVYAYEGALAKKTTYNARKEITRTAVIARKGNIFTETVMSPEGAVLFYQVWTKNDDGSVREMEYRDSKNRLVYRRVFTYDKNGNLAQIVNLNPDGSAAVVIRYEYESFDTSGVWTARSEYFSYADVRNRPHEIVYRTFQ